MSTRCQIRIFDGNLEEPGAMLYHHSDGYPSFMRPKLTRFLHTTYTYLCEAGFPYWRDSERVAAVMVALSIEDYEEPLKPFSTGRKNTSDMNAEELLAEKRRPNNGVPVFQPSLSLHGDIEYLWDIRLLEGGKFELTCREVNGRFTENVAPGRIVPVASIRAKTVEA